MKRRLLYMTLALLMVPLMAAAQWESGTSKTGSVSKNVNDVWYTISLPEDGEVSLTVEPLMNICRERLTIYAIVDGENVQRDFAWVDGPNRTLTCPNLKPGIYKVKMSASPKDSDFSGTYRITYVFTAPTVKTDPTPNATWDDCPLLENGVTMDGHMGYAYAPADVDDVDWFRFEVPKDGKLTFELWSAPTLTFGCATLNALNADGTDVQNRNSKWLDYPDSTLIFEIPEVSAGTYYFCLPRRGGYGIYHLTPRFTPVVVDSEPELNDSWQTATLLSDCQPQNAHLGYYYNQNTYYDNQDWFKIVVPEDGKLTFETRSSSTLTLGCATLNALNSDGTDVLTRNSKWLDYPDSTLVFEIPDVSEGTYYFYMPRRYGYGHYYLTYYFTGHKDAADPEPNDTWDTALELKAGPAVTGQLGYDYKNTLDVQDWYLLNVPEEGSINLTIWSEETLILGCATINTLRANGTEISSRMSQWLDYPGDTLTMTLPNCAAGSYYLYLPHRGGYGTYYLRYNFTPCSKQNDAEPNDEYATAGEFERGTVMEARLGYDYNSSMDDKDWFKLEVPEEGAINLTICSEKTLTLGNATINTLKADGADISSRTGKWLDNPGDTLTFSLANCAAGTYYLCMPRRNGYGGYTMRYDFIPCAIANDEAGNDTWENATPMEAGTTTEARLGYDYNSSMDDKDWFLLDVPEEGAINLTICSEKTLILGNATINTLKADGTDISNRTGKWLDNPGDTLTMILPNCAPGTYYLCMPLRSNYGGYTVKYDFIPCAYANDMAGNDAMDTATPIENGTITQARLGYDYNNSNDVVDWFAFNMEADGSAKFTIQSEKTLTLGNAQILAPKADGDGTISRAGMWLDYPGDTLIFKADNLAAGTYYLNIPLRGGYGGYSIKSSLTKNPYYRETMTNTDFASRIPLEQGQSVYGTLGYEYNTGTRTQAWFDLGLMHGTQIDVNVEVEQSHSLSIGVATLYIYKGDNEDGSPILQSVKSTRLERSSGTISYIDKNNEDSHYVFYLPRYSGYGGYKVTLGQEGEESQGLFLASGLDAVRVMTEGRNTVRKGVPCENPITITNMSNEKTNKFLVAVAATDNIDIIGFRMGSRYGSKYIPIDSVTVVEGNDCQHTAIFYVPSLDPWESYTFNMISEGKGDIAYSREYIELGDGRNKVAVNSTTHAVVTVMGYVDGADRQVFVDDYLIHRIGDVYDLTGEQRLKLSQLMEQLDTEKQQTGVAAYGVYSMLKRASDMCEMELLDATCNIAYIIRQRIEYWLDQIGDTSTDGLDIIDGKAAITDVVASWDPNEMVGPAGVGDEHYIGETQTINYRILFENKAEAGDAAYRIRISDVLDENVFDVSTVRFGETSHDGVGYNWVMTRNGNQLSWDIQGIELPPNVNAPEGEGFVSFSVDLKPNLSDGTLVKNKATIIFDKNYPIETNEFVNTLDLQAPITTKAEAQWTVDKTAVNINCQTSDVASGIASYLLFVSINGGDYIYDGQYLSNQITYNATEGSDALYDFCLFVLDNVGNMERVVPAMVEIATGVNVVNNGLRQPNMKVYTLDGRYAGSSLKNLPQGIYLIDGKKVVIK